VRDVANYLVLTKVLINIYEYMVQSEYVTEDMSGTEENEVV
jgi:hypothetical protein